MSARDLIALRRRIDDCYRCRQMNYVHVLDGANGRRHPRVLIVGEAPGRLGAARTGVPFAGDASGRRFERLLAAAGLRREDVFVTNAVLCNPLRDGRNRRPRASEVAACGAFLAEQVRLIDPAVVVAMGNVALEGLRRVAPHRLSLARDAGRAVEWDGRRLVALYHPSPRTAGRRSTVRQEGDWRALGRALRRAGVVSRLDRPRSPRRQSNSTPS